MLFDDDSRLLEGDQAGEPASSSRMPNLFLATEDLCRDELVQGTLQRILAEAAEAPSKEEKEKAASSHVRKAVHAAKKADAAPKKVEASIREGIKEIYKKSDDELINNTPSVWRSIRHWAVIGGIALFNPVLALAAWYVNKKTRFAHTKQQKEELLHRLKTEVEILNKSIDEETDREAKYAQMRLKAQYERSIKKLTTEKVV